MSLWYAALLFPLCFTCPVGHSQAQEAKAPQSAFPFLQHAKVTLAKATTPDAKTVVVTYAVLGASANSIHFDLYRSPTSDATANVILSADDANPADLTVGEHSISLTPAAGLPPNTALPYVVVVATSGGKKSTVYFRKFLIGVVAHGFNKWAFANNWSPVNLVALPPWETTMVHSLKTIDNYDDVIAFNWTETCAAPRRDMTIQAGLRLAGEVAGKMAIRNRHPGDVVDLHFIGHSRGAVVVTQALQYIAKQDPLLAGSFVHVTLLDPHPANNCFAATCPVNDNPVPNNPVPNNPDPAWASFAKDAKNRLTPSAQIARGRAVSFQQAASDPPVTVPPGIKKLEVWFQHTPASCLRERPGLEYDMNLWGTVDSSALIDQSGLLTNPTDKTSCAQAIGHNQIPALYELTSVDTGKLNREPQQ